MMGVREGPAFKCAVSFVRVLVFSVDYGVPTTEWVIRGEWGLGLPGSTRFDRGERVLRHGDIVKKSFDIAELCRNSCGLNRRGRDNRAP